MQQHRGAILLLVAVAAAIPVQAQVVRPVLSFPREFVYNATIDDAGTTIYAVATTNQLGTNPGYLKQIFRWNAATGAATQLTDFEEGVESVSVSDDGTWLAFVSRADPLGTNHDESAELFVMQSNATALAQLTSENLLPLGARGIRAAVISGSGNRIAFTGCINPLGTNPSYASALFVIDRDGTNLRQLRVGVRLAQDRLEIGHWPDSALDISDDGGRIVYVTDTREIAGINANGTGNHTFTSTTFAAEVVISGNGAKIAYATGSGFQSVRVRSFDGNPATIVSLGGGEDPSITDDATLVYFHRYAVAPSVAGIYRITSTGGAATLVSPDLHLARLSGSGNLIVARGAELLAIDNTGGSQQQLTTTTVPGVAADDFAFATDATALRFSSRIDPLGSNPGNEYEQFSFALDTGQYTQLTDASLPPIGFPVFSDAGDIFFGSNDNPCLSGQIFRRHPSGAFEQLTMCADGNSYTEYLHARADGEAVVYVGDTPSPGLFAIQGDGSGRTYLTSIIPREGWTTAGTGSTTWVAFTDGVHVYRVRGDGTGLQQVTTGNDSPSISDDGNRLTWQTTTSQGSVSASLFDASTGTIVQVPNIVGDFLPPNTTRVTRNGSWVFAGEGRYDPSTLALDPATGFPRSPSQYFEIMPDATGSRWLISRLDFLDVLRPHRMFFLADMNAVPTFTVGKASPTLLSWDPAPTSFRYDVIRGSISSLSIAGSTVDLGPVSCLEDDSPDSHTRGYEDSVDPAPGQTFFFLYRGSVGINATAGSYGQGTGGRERVAGAGECNP